MRFRQPVTARWIADFINAELIGNTDAMATGINEIHSVEPGDIVFVDHPKYYKKCIESDADLIIINQKTEFPEGKVLLVTDEPFEAYQKLVKHFRPFRPSMDMISKEAVIADTAVVMPGVYIGNNVTIGSNTIIYPQVCIMDHCVIGNNVIIQSGTVIGSNAFYYNSKANREPRYKLMESCGRVVIEDHVEIGAGCTVDRGVSGDTIIGAGTKMDNQVHIGHDTVVGKNCIFAGQVGVAGATRIGDNVTLWGQVGVSKTLTIGNNTTVLAKSGVPSSLEANKTYFGAPVEEARDKMKQLVWIKRIPEIWEKIEKLEQRNQGS